MPGRPLSRSCCLCLGSVNPLPRTLLAPCPPDRAADFSPPRCCTQGQLESCSAEASNQLRKLTFGKKQLEKQIAAAQHKLDINNERKRMLDARPERERAGDKMAFKLTQQSRLLEDLLANLRRGMHLVDTDFERLRHAQKALKEDIHDKVGRGAGAGAGQHPSSALACIQPAFLTHVNC